VLAVLAGRAKLEDCQPLFDRVKLTVDGKPIPLNPFMQELIAGTIRGMLSSLKGAKGKRIELRVS
jgi:molybdopterin-guanine dinucleotide biosynthesis protein B